MHLSKEQYAKWKKFNKLTASLTTRKRVSFGKDLPKLKVYPKTIPASYIRSVKKIFDNYN